MTHEEEVEQVKGWISDTEKNLKELIKKGLEYDAYIHEAKSSLRDYNLMLERLEGCNHLYSKAMNQPYPRLCVKCNEPEQPIA